MSDYLLIIVLPYMRCCCFLWTVFSRGVATIKNIGQFAWEKTRWNIFA